MIFKKDERREERLEALEEQITRLETARAKADPGTDEYSKLTSQLDGLYEEKEKHLTSWHSKPEGKAMIVANVFTAVVGLGLATFEHWSPIVGKTATHAVSNVFKNNRRA